MKKKIPVVDTQARVTPRMAKAWLVKNEANRPLSAITVDFYAKQMEAGTWYGGDCTNPVALDVGGNLIDGQHRLAAVIKYGKSVRLWVATNCRPQQTRKAVDKGKTRTLAQTLHMEHGISNANRIAACCRLLFVFDGVSPRLTRMTADEVLDLMQKYKSSFHWYQTDIRRHKAISQAIVFAPMLWVYKKYPAQMTTFAAGLYSGENLPAGSAVLKLREHILAGTIKTSQYMQLLQTAYTFTALRAHVKRKPLRLLRPNFEAIVAFRKELGRSKKCDRWHDVARDYYQRTRKGGTR